MLEVKGLSKQLGEFTIKDVSFSVGTGDYFVLMGASGVGKTVLLEAIAGVTVPDSGSIHLAGNDITRVPIQRRNMGLVYQDQALFPHLPVHVNMSYGLRAVRMHRHERDERVAELAEQLGIAPLLNRMPDTLSGGEAQRVALARALARKPSCLLLDEPLSSLDVHARTGIRRLLRGLNRRGQTVLHVTHDYEEAISLATRLGVMEDGTVKQIGTPEEVFHHPKSQFVAGFVGIKNFLAGELLPPEDADCAAEFVSDGLRFSVLTDAPAGPGHAVLRSEDVTISLAPASSSACNVFPGTVTEIVRAPLGTEVLVDIGVEIAVLVTRGSQDRLGLQPGRKVFVSIKASAIRVVPA